MVKFIFFTMWLLHCKTPLHSHISSNLKCPYYFTGKQVRGTKRCAKVDWICLVLVRLIDFVYALIDICFYIYSDFQEDQATRPHQLPRLKVPSTKAGGLPRMISNSESLSIYLWSQSFLCHYFLCHYFLCLFGCSHSGCKWLTWACLWFVHIFLKYHVRNHDHVNSK